MTSAAQETLAVARPSRRGPWRWLFAAGRKIVTERASPARLAWAVGLGVLIGCSPFIGLHLMIVIIVATLLGLNRAVTYLAANISVPWMQPILLFASVQLGTFVLAGHFLPMSMDALRGIEPVSFGLSWLVGSFLLGVLIGAPAGWLTYVSLTAYRRKHPLPLDPLADALEATLERFARQGRFLRGYVRGKLLGDPLYRQVAAQGPFHGTVLDLGCGRGLAAILLRTLQPEVRVLAFDWDEKKLAGARQVAGEGGELRFSLGDVTQVELPAAETILLLDVLHYCPRAAQDALLSRAAQALAPGGRILLRDIDDGPGFRPRLTRWLERLGQILRLHRGATLAFRPMAEIVERLGAAGLRCELSPSVGELPTANVFVVATKARAALPVDARAHRRTALGCPGAVLGQDFVAPEAARDLLHELVETGAGRR